MSQGSNYIVKEKYSSCVVVFVHFLFIWQLYVEETKVKFSQNYS